MKWCDVKDADLNGALAAVKYGHDPVAAMNLIEYFHERFKGDFPYNERILIEFIGHAFSKIIEDRWGADHAFGLKLTRGKYEREDNYERNVIAAAYVILLMRKKWTYLDARGEAANLLFPDGKGEKAVEAAYAMYSCHFKSLPSGLLEAMLPLGTPVISRHMTG
ncbi:MAG TPA: hypothetical protein PKL28_11205 [Rhodocyclaceae bacterium]|jgi:hypothetical protein|nr:hypothetical protein [Rhodocyclaceae bacterium]HNL21754.1 hypothetical protein [Rhodocyclaceae bacterium]HNM81615.1 hypothetical protein [Rhodocyclaceae bacterium]HNP04567.1 hypothetical protein [Rhodocyclaceae bacterium]